MRLTRARSRETWSVALRLILCLSLPPQFARGATPAFVGDDLAERLDRIIEGAARSAQGVVAVIDLGGESLYAAGHGRLHFDDGSPAGPRSILPAGMLTDFWSALAALRLVEDGLLDLSAAVELPGFEPGERTIQVRHLLTHTSGLPSPARLPAAARREGDGEVPQDWSFLTADGLLHEPDTCQTFSSGNTWALGAIVERTADRSLAEYLEEAILEPAGLRRTGWEAGAGQRLDEPGNWIEYAGELRHDPTGCQRFGSADMVTTVADLGRLLRALASRSLLGDLSLGRLAGEPRLSDGTPIPYAYGWNRTTLDELEGFTLGGANGHEHLHAAWYPALDVIVVLASDDDEHELSALERRLVREIFDLADPSYEERELPEGAAVLYAGEYREGCNSLQVLATEDGLLITSSLHPETHFGYVGGHQFVARGNPRTQILFQVVPGARAHALVWTSSGTCVVAQRFGD